MNDMTAPKKGLLSIDDSVLVIIDMQERLVPVIAEKEMIVDNVVKLVKFARIVDLPVVITEQQNLGDTLPEIREHLAGLKTITKLEFNCFKAESFVVELKQLERNALIIAGVEAHICVAQTAIHAQASHTVHVVSDAISSRSLHNRDVAIHRILQSGVTITSTEMVIYELLEKAGTNAFREVLKLVK